MKALLKLISTNEDANKLLKICKKNSNKILHKKHGQELNKSIISAGGFSINFGGYGSFSNLGLGDNFHTKWELEASGKKQFSKVMVSLDKSIDKELVNKISTFIEKNDGEIVSQEKCNLLVKNEKRKTLPKKPRWERDTAPLDNDLEINEFIDVSIEELLTKFPSINPKPKKTIKLSNETKQNIKNLQKRDLDVIEKTIQNISSDQQEIEAILSGVDVNKEGEIERGTYFKGTKPSLSYSDLGLLNLLSISEVNSKGCEIRNSIKKMDLTVQEIPILKGFDALEHLTISIINKNELNIKDLSSFSEFKSLKSLTIQLDKSVSEDIRPTWSDKKVVISSIDGLKAPKLEYLTIMNLGLSDVKFLNNCKELLQLSLDENEELEDINSLTNCSKLKILNLNKTSVKTLEPLRDLSLLEIISISDCDSLNNLKGLENLKIKISDNNINNENRDFDESTLSRLESLVSIEHLPKLNSEKLLIREVNLSNLKGIESSNHLEELIIQNSSKLKFLGSLSELKNLKKIELSTCPEIKDYSVLSELDSLETCLLGDRYSVFSSDEGEYKEEILPKRWPETLKYLRLSTSATRIGDLPKNLQNIELFNCVKLKSLEELKLCSILNESYEGSGFYGIEGQIDLSSCPSLINLEGLENKSHINKIIISPFVTNLDAISEKEDLEITIKFEKIDGFDELTKISDELSMALSKLKNFKMIIEKGWDAKQVEDISNISSLKNIESLDLDRLYIEDLSFISTMENLKYIRLQANDLTRDLKRRVFDTEGQIAKLKMKLLSS